MAGNTEKVLQALSDNPALLEKLLAAKKEQPTRALPGQDPTSLFLKGILGDNVDTTSTSDALEKNGLMQLYLGADGDIDAKELMDFVGGFSGKNAEKNQSVKALLDGKLDFKEILMLLALMKLIKGKKPAAQQNSGLGLLGTLLGANTQQQPQQNSALNLFSNMLNQQAAQPVQPQSQSLFGNLFGVQQAQPQQNANQQVFSLTGNANNAAANNGMNILQSLLGGNTGVTQNNAQAQNLYSLLNNNSANAFNSNGSVNVGTLFSLANQLLGGR